MVEKRKFLPLVLFLILTGLILSYLNPNSRTYVGGKPRKPDTERLGKDLKKATFAGGCFWCMEHPFEKREGINEAVSGFMGGHVKDPSYKEVASGGTGHVEVIHFQYDPDRISYKQLLEIYWRKIDPTDGKGQFVDRGPQYRPRIFYHNNYQKRLAQRSKHILNQSEIFDEPIRVKIKAAGSFYRASDYHQDFCYLKPGKYKRYVNNSGRPEFLHQVWKNHKDFQIFSENGWDPSQFQKPGNKQLQEMLTPLQYRVTQEQGTEPRHDNKYWDHKKSGIYVDIVSGEPLFSSRHKWDSGTGWPHFYKPLVNDHIITRPDHSHGLDRTEVLSRHAKSHLGHLFESDSTPTGKTYCMNSAALKFIPVNKLEEKGYGEFVPHFERTD